MCGNNLRLRVVRQHAKGKSPFVLTLSKRGRIVDHVALSLRDTRRIWESLNRDAVNYPEFWQARYEPTDDDTDPYEELGGEG